jgi:hypothetical protein
VEGFRVSRVYAYRLRVWGCDGCLVARRGWVDTRQGHQPAGPPACAYPFPIHDGSPAQNPALPVVLAPGPGGAEQVLVATPFPPQRYARGGGGEQVKVTQPMNDKTNKSGSHSLDK